MVEGTNSLLFKEKGKNVENRREKLIPQKKTNTESICGERKRKEVNLLLGGVSTGITSRPKGNKQGGGPNITTSLEKTVSIGGRTIGQGGGGGARKGENHGGQNRRGKNL